MPTYSANEIRTFLSYQLYVLFTSCYSSLYHPKLPKQNGLKKRYILPICHVSLHRNLVLIVHLSLELYRGFEECQHEIGTIENSSFLVFWMVEFQNQFFAPTPISFLCLCTQNNNKMGFVIRKSTKNDSKEILKLIQVIKNFTSY